MRLEPVGLSLRIEKRPQTQNKQREMANETENTILAFTEWLDANDKSYLLIVSGGKDENICIAHDTKGNLVEAIAQGMVQHRSLFNLLLYSFIKLRK